MESRAFVFRPALPSDLPAIMELELAGFDGETREEESTFARRLELLPDGFVLMADAASGAVAGYYCAERWPAVPPATAAAYALGGDPAVRCDPRGPVLYTASMTLHPAYRGGGSGAAFFRGARAFALERLSGVRTELLLVREAWKAARRIYAACGFAETGRIPGFFAEAEDGAGIVMEKPA